MEQSELEADAGLDISTEDIGLGDGATSISPATSEAPINTDKPTVSPSSISMSFEGRMLNLPFDYSILTEAGWKAVDDGEYSFLVMKMTTMMSRSMSMTTTTAERKLTSSLTVCLALTAALEATISGLT